LYGIPEESATGSASGALACYLKEHLALGNDYVFEQGRAMNCASIITASVKTFNTEITSINVGGYARNIEAVNIRL